VLGGVVVARAAAPHGLRSGVRVEVKGTPTDAGAFLADEIVIRDDGDDDEELRGVIESIDHAAGQMKLLGFTVQLSAATPVLREPEGTASLADLVPGMRVKVDGRYATGHAFLADKVKIRGNQQYRERKIVGPIESLELSGATPRLRLLGVDVIVGETTELVGPGGRGRSIVQRRLGALDEDDLLFTGRTRLGRYLALAGEVRLGGERPRNVDLDRETEDEEIVVGSSAILGLAADLGAVFAYTEVVGEQETLLQSEDPFPAREHDLRLGEAYVELRKLPVPRATLAIGRQKFNEQREWHYNKKNLDALRVLLDLAPWTIEASVSRDLFDRSRNTADQNRTNMILLARRTWGDALVLEVHVISREDRTTMEDSPRILGVRLLGEPGRYVDYWIDLARETGRRGLFDAPTGLTIVRDVRAEALDVGWTYRPRVWLDPSFSVGYAQGSGARDVDLPVDLVERAAALQALSGGVDRTFRQSGLQRNRDKFNGVVSFRYYGEVLDPELTNLRIWTVGLGLRPWRKLSIDLLYHGYRQDRAAADLRGSDLDMDPDGSSPDLGRAFDVAVGYEPTSAFELRMTGGLFIPGSAFEAQAATASVVRLQSKFRF